MFILKMKDLNAMHPDAGICTSSKLGSMSSDLIVIAPGSTSINFVIMYAMHPFHGGMNFKVHCVQMGLTGPNGEDLGTIPNQPLIDIVIPQITVGSTVEKISSFLQKFIMVECGLHYQYESHCSLAEEYSDINRWASLFSNVSKVVKIDLNTLDEKLSMRIYLMKMTQSLIENKTAARDNVKSGYFDSGSRSEDGSAQSEVLDFRSNRSVLNPSPMHNDSIPPPNYSGQFKISNADSDIEYPTVESVASRKPLVDVPGLVLSSMPRAVAVCSGFGTDLSKYPNLRRENPTSRVHTATGGADPRRLDWNLNDGERDKSKRSAAKTTPSIPTPSPLKSVSACRSFVPPPPVPSAAW
jgi:hypothetical protein